MNFKIISILTIIFLFLGCSTKENKYIKPTDTLHEQAMTQTKKTVIKTGDITKIFISATYINQIKNELINEDNKREKFIINLYVPSEQNQNYYSEVIYIINENKLVFLKELKNNDELLKIIPGVTPWNRYYLLEAPINEKNKTITFRIEALGEKSSTLNFVKDNL